MNIVKKQLRIGLVCSFAFLPVFSFASKYIYLTETAVYGDMTAYHGSQEYGPGITGADEWCNADTNRPTTSSTYKALIASTDRHPGKDWPLQTKTIYVNSDNTIIGTTNNRGVFIFDLSAPFSTYVSNYYGSIPSWTGLTSHWAVSEMNCTNWTIKTGSSGSSQEGSIGQPSSLTSTSISYSDLPHSICNTYHPLYCVEQ